MKLEINNRRKLKKSQHRETKTQTNNQWIQRIIKIEIKSILRQILKKMKTQHAKTWEAITAVIRRKFVEIKIPKKKRKNLK